MLLATVVFSCQKTPVKPEINFPESEPQFSSSSNLIFPSGIIESNEDVPDSELFLNIASLKFKANIIPAQNGPSDDFEPVSLDNLTPSQFIYNLEATLNNDLYRIHNGLTDFSRVKGSIPVSYSIDNSEIKIDESVLVATYQSVHQEITNSNEVTSPRFVNAWMVLNEMDNLFLEYEITYANNISSPDISLTNEDSWWSHDALGKCSPSVPSTVGLDVTDRLQNLINWYGFHGWNGSSSNSTGGMAVGCSGSYTGTWGNLTYPWYFDQDADPNIFPWEGCYLECMNQNDIENEMASYFSAYNFLAGHVMIIEYSAPNTQYLLHQNLCQNLPNVNIGYHQVNFTLGDFSCTPALPW